MTARKPDPRTELGQRFRDAGLPVGGARMVALALLSYAKRHDLSDAWPSQVTLAAVTGLDVRSVQRALKRLASLGLVEVEHHAGRVSHYSLTTTSGTAPKRRGSGSRRLDAGTGTAPERRGGTAPERRGGTASGRRRKTLNASKAVKGLGDEPSAPPSAAGAAPGSATAREVKSAGHKGGWTPTAEDEEVERQRLAYLASRPPPVPGYDKQLYQGAHCRFCGNREFTGHRAGCPMLDYKEVCQHCRAPKPNDGRPGPHRGDCPDSRPDLLPSRYPG